MLEWKLILNLQSRFSPILLIVLHSIRRVGIKNIKRSSLKKHKYMAGFQTPITIAQAIEHIRKNEYLLPAFQRDFVWSAEQIEKLFDSLMKGFPISSMLFWKVKGETKTDFRFYRFLTNYVQYHKICNDSIPTDQVNDFHAILDGQQRLFLKKQTYTRTKKVICGLESERFSLCIKITIME